MLIDALPLSLTSRAALSKAMPSAAPRTILAAEDGVYVNVAGVPRRIRSPGCLRIGAAPKDFLIAGAFTFGYKSGPEPPDNGVEPKQSLNHHVKCRGEIVSPAHVTELVREHGSELIGR